MITDEQRRARLAVRHRLLPRNRTDDLSAVAEAVVALHSSDPVTVYLSAAGCGCAIRRWPPSRLRCTSTRA